MKKRRKTADISIGKRAYQEVLRLFPKMKDAEKVVGCTDYTIYQWNKGVSPSAIYLARLLDLGADIQWILTGKMTPVPFTEKEARG